MKKDPTKTGTLATPAQIKKIIAATLKDHKALDVLALNVKTLTDVTDYIIIGTANSTVHVKTLIDKTCNQLATIQIKPIGIEGENTREWMLVDYGAVIVHIMLDHMRKFYDLERLWKLNKLPPKKPASKRRTTN